MTSAIFFFVCTHSRLTCVCVRNRQWAPNIFGRFSIFYLYSKSNSMQFESGLACGLQMLTVDALGCA